MKLTTYTRHVHSLPHECDAVTTRSSTTPNVVSGYGTREAVSVPLLKAGGCPESKSTRQPQRTSHARDTPRHSLRTTA